MSQPDGFALITDSQSNYDLVIFKCIRLNLIHLFLKKLILLAHMAAMTLYNRLSPWVLLRTRPMVIPYLK